MATEKNDLQTRDGSSELLPESEQLWQSRLSGLSTMLGMLLGMALIFTHIH